MFERFDGIKIPAGKETVNMPETINPNEFIGTPDEVAKLAASQAEDRKLFDERAKRGNEILEEAPSAAIGSEHIRMGAVAAEDTGADADAAAKLAEQRAMDSMQAFFEESQRNAAEKEADRGTDQTV